MLKLLVVLPLTFGSIINSNEIARAEDHQADRRHSEDRHTENRHSDEALQRRHAEQRTQDNLHYDINHAGNLNTGGGGVVPVPENTQIVFPPAN